MGRETGYRFITEVAPPPITNVLKRKSDQQKAVMCLETIEEDQESEDIEDLSRSLKTVPFCDDVRRNGSEGRRSMYSISCN